MLLMLWTKFQLSLMRRTKLFQRLKKNFCQRMVTALSRKRSRLLILKILDLIPTTAMSILVREELSKIWMNQKCFQRRMCANLTTRVNRFSFTRAKKWQVRSQRENRLHLAILSVLKLMLSLISLINLWSSSQVESKVVLRCRAKTLKVKKPKNIPIIVSF